MRKNFQTTIEEALVKRLKIEAINRNKNVNEILEKLIEKFLNGETAIEQEDKV